MLRYEYRIYEFLIPQTQKELKNLYGNLKLVESSNTKKKSLLNSPQEHELGYSTEISNICHKTEGSLRRKLHERPVHKTTGRVRTRKNAAKPRTSCNREPPPH